MSNNCQSGQIQKVGYSYVKKSSKKTVKVKPTCIEDKGNPGKGPKLITIPSEDEGILGKYGYRLKDSHQNRIKALKKAFKENSHLKILRHLNAIRTLQKSNETYFKKLDKDMKWLQEYYKKFKT
jgi:hypothetical protein